MLCLVFVLGKEATTSDCFPNEFKFCSLFHRSLVKPRSTLLSFGVIKVFLAFDRSQESNRNKTKRRLFCVFQQRPTVSENFFSLFGIKSENTSKVTLIFPFKTLEIICKSQSSMKKSETLTSATKANERQICREDFIVEDCATQSAKLEHLFCWSSLEVTAGEGEVKEHPALPAFYSPAWPTFPLSQQ